MDIRKLKKLIELVNETGIAELEVEEEKERVRITRGGITAAAVTPTHVAIAPAPIMPDSPVSPPAAPAAKKHTVNSPMVGTVYLAPSSGAKPFVEIGQRVKVGDILCLVEAMKMFNRIEADKDGIIATRLVENEHPVEYGQALFVIDDN
jgi:acetyl-CoA carboxylase biotin carboxyl carrier protein